VLIITTYLFTIIGAILSAQLTIERSIVFKTMDRQCESFSQIFSSATRLDKSFIFIRNTWTSSSINENSEFDSFEKVDFNINVHGLQVL
jgi:hypothetical protein